MVLRRAPRGVEVKAAHDMRRELRRPVRSLSLLFEGSESPRVLLGRLGRRGSVLPHGTRPRHDPARPCAPCGPLPFTLFDAGSLGEPRRRSSPRCMRSTSLRDRSPRSGEPEGYAARQVAGWTERWGRARTRRRPRARRGGGLAHGAPSGARPMPLGSFTNDFKFDDVVLDPADPTRIVAVLDWEMAALGDPLLDLGATLGYWIDPDDADDVRALPFGATRIPGCLSRPEVAQRWAKETSTRRCRASSSRTSLASSRSRSYRRRQIYKRYVLGHTRDPRFRRDARRRAESSAASPRGPSPGAGCGRALG